MTEPYGFFNVAANRELRDQAWIAEYLTTGMTAEAGPKTRWDSPDADVIGDLRRFIETERRRVFTLDPPPPVAIHPDYFDEYRDWINARRLEDDRRELAKRLADRLNLASGSRRLLNAEELATIEGAIDTLRRTP